MITRLKWKLLTEEHENYEQNREIAIKLSEKDPKFFINNFVFTYDPRGKTRNTRHLPFLLYDFQEKSIDEIVRHIEEEIDLLVDKSRDMGASWILIATLFWGWKFKEWDVLVGSRKEDYVDKRGDINSLIEKFRYINRMLPDWLQESLKEGVSDKSMFIQNPRTKNIVAGESNNQYFGTGGRFKVAVLDEFPKWEQTDESAWVSLGDATPCRIANGTPSNRGMNCHAYKLIEQGIDRISLHWLLHPKKNIGLYYERGDTKTYLNTENEDDLKLAESMRRSGIPLGSEWYDKEKERRSELELAQELDIAYDASLAGAIFDKFNFQKQIIDYEYDPYLPVYCGADFGMDTTSFVFIQYKGGKYFVFDEYENKGEDIYHYLEVLDAKQYRVSMLYGDPYSGGIKQMQSANSLENILRRNGIRAYCRNRASIQDRIHASRVKLGDTFVSRNCPLFIDMLQNWRFKKPVRNSDKPVPEHSQQSHIGEAFGYFALEHGNFRTKIVKSRYSHE